MVNKTLAVFVIALFSMLGVYVLVVIWLWPMPLPEKIMDAMIAATGLVVALSGALSVKPALVRRGMAHGTRRMEQNLHPR